MSYLVAREKRTPVDMKTSEDDEGFVAVDSGQRAGLFVAVTLVLILLESEKRVCVCVGVYDDREVDNLIN